MAYRRVEISVPFDKKETTFTAIQEKLLDFNPVHPEHVGVADSQDFVVFSVNVHPNQVGDLLHFLEGRCGVGEDFGLITILTAQAAKPPPPRPLSLQEQLEREGKTCHPTWMQKYGQSRMSIEEIHTAIDGGNSLDFNFWCFLIGAAIIAGGGLATNSSVMVVASMLVSPLMGPILAITFGLTTRDYALARSGALNELAASTATFILGILFGLVVIPLAKDLHLPSNEMAGRGNIGNFVVGVIFAVASGVIVGVAVTGGGINSLVGVAISASLLPPIVNSGMLISFASIGPSQVNEDSTGGATGLSGACHAMQAQIEDCDFIPFRNQVDGIFSFKGAGLLGYEVDSSNLYKQAAWSLGLYAMNVVVIGIVCIATFHVKHIVPDPYDKLGHQWANPANRDLLKAKRNHVANTLAKRGGAAVNGTNGNGGGVELSNKA